MRAKKLSPPSRWHPKNQLKASHIDAPCSYALAHQRFKHLRVLLGGEEVSLVRDAQANHPAIPVGVFVNLLGSVFECGIDLDDLTTDRSNQVGAIRSEQSGRRRPFRTR